MKKRILAVLMMLALLGSLFPATMAASNEEAALGEVDIYNGGTKLSYLSINGSVQTFLYTYYNYVSANGQVKEIPAYCVAPNLYGVPQTVGAGESIKYTASEKAADPKVMGIVANGYPTRSLGELGLENKEQAYYATKAALWCYIIPNWNIGNLKVNPSLSGDELTRAQKILAAAKNIYANGVLWDKIYEPNMTVTADRAVAYPVTINGKQYKQQVFSFQSETWICDYVVDISFVDPSAVPSGTRIVDMENRDITSMITTNIGTGFAGQFKMLYPVESIEGQSGNVQFALRANGYRYGVYYAVCAEKDKYGNLQNYMCDTDPTTPMSLSGISSYSAGTTVKMDTGLTILKFETGTEKPLSGALFEVIDPNGATVGTFASNDEGKIELPLDTVGNYTVIERQSAADHKLGDVTVQNVTVEYGKIATVTFYNAPYGKLRVQKMSDVGDYLSGVTVQVKNIVTGVTYTEKTGVAGAAIFDVAPGAYEVKEVAGISGWIAETDTVQTVSVATGETSAVTFINRELPGLRIVKYSRTDHTLMSGVTFEIFRDGISLGRYQTDAMGEILLTDVKPGTYRAVEVDTGNDGYILNTTPQEIELSAGDGVRELLFFNEQKPGMRLIKVDSTDPSKVIPNAVFEIKSVAGDYGPKEFTTDQNGEIDLSKLPTGAYVVTEKSCEGYVIDDAQRIIQLDANEDAQFVFTNTIKPSLQIIKTSSDGTALKGVTFRIAKIEDGTHYLDRTTNANGEILISDLEPGVYSVKETATDSSHILDVREYHMELFPGKTSTLVIENQKRPNLIVYKHDADTGEPIANTVFEVRAADGHSVDEIKTDSEGRAELKNLLPSVYEITEKSVPSDYLLDAPSQLVTLYANRDHTVYFENHKKPSLTVKKIDSVTGDLLQGAKFQVTYASNATSSGEINDLGTYYTDENGQFRITNLKDGWYKVTELESPTGYAIKEATQEVYIQSGTAKTLTFENIPLSALVVWKYDSVTGEAVEGAVFQVKYLSGTSGTGGTVIGTYKTSANGSFTVTGLRAGTYVVEELASDSGHVIDTAPQTAYISGEEQDVVQLYFGNAPKGSLLVKKIDSVTKEPLSDVEFFVATSEGTVVGNANGKFVTDSAGSFTVEGITHGTTLVVKETRAKDGYLLDDTPQTAQIKAGQTVTLEFRNQPKGNLVIHKLDSVTKEPLEGVQFKITYADGSYVDAEGGQLSSNGLYWTDENGQIKISGITGTLVVTEEKTIDGYTIHEETRSQTVVVNTNDTQSLTFYNDPVGGLLIIKSDEDTGKRISGVQFEVRKMNGEIIGSYTTDRNGVIQLPELESGWYTVTELKAASGYLLDTTPQQVEVKDGQTATLELTNHKSSKILLHKTDAQTGKGIYGAVFLLYDSNKNPIGEYTTDQDGYIYMDEDLADGRYYLREIKTADGYVLDTELKTIYVRYGSTTEIEWTNTAECGQIQIIKKSADDNVINGLPAGTLLEGAVFEIYDKAGNTVDTIKTDKNGRAVSKTLPLSRYTIREVTAPSYYAINPTVMTAYLEYSGQIVTFEVEDESISTGVSIKKTGPVQAVSGQPVRYVFSNVQNTSSVSLNSFYWRDTLPAQVTLNKIVTGSYNQQLSYKVVYQTNLSTDYRTLADNLSTSRVYVLDTSPAVLGLAANERVTEVRFVFGTVKAGFAQVETPYFYTTARSGLANGTSIVNVADVGGLYNGAWVQAVSRWLTTVYAQTVTTLPKTGY